MLATFIWDFGDLLLWVILGGIVGYYVVAFLIGIALHLWDKVKTLFKKKEE